MIYHAANTCDILVEADKSADLAAHLLLAAFRSEIVLLHIVYDRFRGSICRFPAGFCEYYEFIAVCTAQRVIFQVPVDIEFDDVVACDDYLISDFETIIVVDLLEMAYIEPEYRYTVVVQAEVRYCQRRCSIPQIHLSSIGCPLSRFRPEPLYI